MPINKLAGLRGLRGINSLSREEYDDFVERNKDLIAKHNNDPSYINGLYKNKIFIDTYGLDKFKSMPSMADRDSFTIQTEFDKLYSPWNEDGTRDNSKGLGALYDKYNEMSNDGKLKLLESGYLSPSEYENNLKTRTGDWKDAAVNAIGNLNILPGTALLEPLLSKVPYGKTIYDLINPASGLKDAGLNAAKYFYNKHNDNIIESIYDEDLTKRTRPHDAEVSLTLTNDPSIADVSEDQTRADFHKAITPGSYTDERGLPNMGIPEYAAYYGDGSAEELQSEMKDFSIEEMKQILAKKKVYEKYMSPGAVSELLNNEAKRYIRAHQGTLTRAGLFAKDVVISALSYTADKANGIYNLELMAEDAFSKPQVYVDDEGDIVDENYYREHMAQDDEGHYGYIKEKDGKFHRAAAQEISRIALRNMGKNPDGSDNEGVLNPLYWTRAEQFGTLDSELQKKYESLGTSPYKVAYNPGEESDLWYESFKMMSFAYADAVSQLIPYGIGAAGKVLSNASKVGNITRKLGAATGVVGDLLSSETKVGQVLQGTAGALGIANAYERGAFQETLAKNYAEVEEALLNRSRQEVNDRYHQDEDYRQEVDTQIDALAKQRKAEAIRQAKLDGGSYIDSEGHDAIFRQQAQREVIEGLVRQQVEENKSSGEYMDLMAEAVNSAGATANMVFIPEALKYAYVNTIGFRKFFYTNPVGFAKKIPKAFKGIEEVTTGAGRQRLAVTAPSKFLTRGAKLKQFGKQAVSQFWGGAWTNGTDDMMVDAAEQVYADDFNRHLNAYQNGEALADTYGFADGYYTYMQGLDSYMKGLGYSLGQESTWKAAGAGGFGSILNITPHFTNIASLLTKSGRQNYVNRYMRRNQYDTDASGFKKLRTDEHGNPITTPIKKGENWRDRAAFFIQNGVLNDYYAAKQSETDLQNHADYINGILDDTDDFQVIEDLIASDIDLDNADNFRDATTAKYIKAIQVMRALDQMSRKEDVGLSNLSSVFRDARSLIDVASQMSFEDDGDAVLNDETTENLLAQYYANHPGIPMNDYNSQKALYQIAQNAQELKDAAKAYEEAETQVQKVERALGRTIPSTVRNRMKMDQALDKHWKDRLETMKSEIDDTSTENELSENLIIPTLGSKKNAEALLKVYEKQQDELDKEIEEHEFDVRKAENDYKEALNKIKKAANSSEEYATQQEAAQALSALEDTKQQHQYLNDLLAISKKKQADVKKAIDNIQVDSDGKDVVKTLTADEIFALDPVTRARMLRPENRVLYSPEQQKEINKLETQLLMRDGNALQKIQDIAALTQRIKSNQDAYSRMAKNPEAAAVQLETQRTHAANTAYNLINRRNAEILANVIDEFDLNLEGREDITQEQKDEFVYNLVRKYNPTLLDILEEEHRLPKYQKQIADAKGWIKTTSDIDAVIYQSDDTDIRKESLSSAIYGYIKDAMNEKEIISILEKIVDDTEGTATATDVDNILKGLEELGHSRDATVVENREKRKARQEQERAAKEAAEKKAKEEAEAAAAKKAAEEAEKRKIAETQAQQPEVPENMNTEKGNKANRKPGAFEDANLKDVPLDTDEDKGNNEDEVKVVNENEVETPKESPEAADMLRGVQQKETSSVNDNMKNNIIDNGDTVQVESPTIEEQLETTGPKEQHTVSSTTDVEAINTTKERVAETSASTLNANAFEEWVIDKNHQNEINKRHGNPKVYTKDLFNDGVLVHKEGNNTNSKDSMNLYYAWMKAAGIKLQDIIDMELAEILRRNPHAKVKFMTVRDQNNSTHDSNMKTHLLLVLDYDNNVNKHISDIHSDENGGVIESNGKKYLIVGVAGYGSSADKLALYDILFSKNPNKGNGYGLVLKGKKEFFNSHPNERYYVPEGLSTEIVPESLTPGRIVKQLEGEEGTKYRSISELLKDSQRNPLGLDMQSLAWGIQKEKELVVVGIPSDRAMVLRNPDRNQGNAFVMIPAGNGKFVSSYLKPLFYNEMNDGKLKERVNDLLQEVVSPNYATRLAAVKSLGQIFHFSKEGDNILLGKDDSRRKNEVAIKRGESTIKTFVLTSDFNRQEFMEAIADMNPRINITTSVLQSPVLLQQYDEAGALQTDVARLATAGSSYSIYGVDAQGNMIEKTTTDNNTPKEASVESSSKWNVQVVYNHNYYNYDAATGNYSLDGKDNIVKEATLIKQLDYNRRIFENGLIPALTEGVWDYYVLSSEEHPEVIKVNKNTKFVKEVAEKQAKELLDKIAKEKSEKERDDAAKQEIERLKMVKEQYESGEANVSEVIIDPTTGEIVYDNKTEAKEEEEKAPVEQQASVENNEATRNAVKPRPIGQGNTQTIKELINSKSHRVKVIMTIKNKWPEAPINVTELEKFLRSKNIEVDAIGVSEADIQAWIKTLEDCR